MPRKLHYSLIPVVAIALVAPSTISSAKPRWATNTSSGISVRPVSSTQSKQPKGYIGRNDGYVQQSTQGGTRQSLQGRTTGKGSDAIRSTPAVKLYKY
jgi:hypothetical protein